MDATTAYVFLLLAALQGGLGIPLLLALILAFLVLIPFIVQVFRRAAKRNPKRPGGEDDDGGEVSEGRERQVVRFFGMLLAATGVLLALTGVVCAFFPNLVGNVVPAASLGIFLGFAGYAMRARRMGAAAAIIATAALLLGVAASQGIIPGVEPTDRNLPSVEPSDSQGD